MEARNENERRDERQRDELCERVMEMFQVFVLVILEQNDFR